MPTLRTAPQYLAIATLLVAIQPVVPAMADEGRNRSGFYVGGHAGYVFGNANATLADPLGLSSAGGVSLYGTSFGGIQAGYEHYFPSRLMLGIEVDGSFFDQLDNARVLSYRATATGTASEELEYEASLRGRIGFDLGGWTPFVTGGIAWASTRYSRIDLTTGNEDANPSNIRRGYIVGGGVDYRLDSRWSARAEYLYTNFGLGGFAFASAPARYDSQYDQHQFRLGLNYKFGEVDDPKAKPYRGPGSFEVHGQGVFVYQGYPPFNAPYDGPQSLPSAGQSRQTSALSGSLGIRLWEGGEFYFAPELLQGFGVAQTQGVAGFPNGEAQRDFPYPRFSMSRVFLRQTIGLGGETEKVESDYDQLAGKRDVSRVTITAGRYAVQDIFDNNAYANDPRVDFLNWSIWAAGAFDYAADSIGFTWGVAAELNQPNWTVRFGYFLEPALTDTDSYDMALFARGEYIAELELRYRPFDRPGAVRLAAWLNSAFAGSYNQAVALAALTPGLNANNTIAQTEQGRTKYGFYVNLEQELSDNVGAFARFSWNDGRTEIMSFTDITTSLSAGLSIKGTPWGRPGDTIGVAGAVNSISADLANYLAAGGLGILIGDGALTYAPEVVAETYYSLRVAKGLYVTADYQFIANPAYNAVRGPAHFFSGRLMAKF
ncbi:MAG TPA: carbohydrate porin [Reyranella sp.]|jgi:high affinity Mn2+ porin|nr:carbohydrate porin [Reyranella sp.]